MKTDNKIDVLGERFIEWKNVADKVDVEGGIRMQRVPETWCLRFPEGAAGRSRQSANVRLCLTTDSPFITLRWRTITQGVPGVVFCDGKQVCEFPSFPLMTEREDTFTAPTSGAHQWEVHFPWHAEIVMGSVLISESARLLENKFPPKSTMLFYGSSITQGFRASTGAKTWPWICSQLLGVECLNLGFGGVAFYERVVAEYIYSIPLRLGFPHARSRDQQFRP